MASSGEVTALTERAPVAVSVEVLRHVASGTQAGRVFADEARTICDLLDTPTPERLRAWAAREDMGSLMGFPPKALLVRLGEHGPTYTAGYLLSRIADALEASALPEKGQ